MFKIETKENFIDLYFLIEGGLCKLGTFSELFILGFLLDKNIDTYYDRIMVESRSELFDNCMG